MLERYEVLKNIDKEVVCEHCQKSFAISKIVFQSACVQNEKHEMMEVLFFLCPHCQAIYVVTIKDSKSKKLQMYCEKIKKLLCSSKQQELLREAERDYLAARQRLLSYQRYLKMKYEKHLYLTIEGSDRSLKNGENKEE